MRLPSDTHSREVRIGYDSRLAPEVIANHLARLLAEVPGKSPDEWLLICIGTDRSTGDALGPLVGEYLAAAHLPGLTVLGTLERPVHASNLTDTIALVERRFPSRPVVAVDACLGLSENVGAVSVGQGPLRPGAGVNKDLPPVGDLFITGTVNVGGMMEYLVLQNTRLYLVMRMAETIATGVTQGLGMLRPSARQRFAEQA